MVKIKIRNRANLPTPWMKQFVSNETVTTQGNYTGYYTLYEVPVDKSYFDFPRSMVIGNTSITVTAESNDVSKFENVCVALMRLPEGVDIPTVISTSFIDNHPEWVFCYKYIGSPIGNTVGQQFHPQRVSSNKRIRLHTGDKLVVAYQYTKTVDDAATGLTVRGETRGRSRLQ